MVFIFLGTVINYVDRQTLAVLAPDLQRDLGINHLQYAAMGTVFLLTYSLSMTGWGFIFDRLGNRLAYAAAVAWWSIAEMAHGAARGLLSFSILRGVLGLGESGAWPGAARTATAWFRSDERALCIGISNAGTAVGSAVAAPLIVGLAVNFGWRATFVSTGALGFVWLAGWFAFYPKREPIQARAADAAEAAAPSPQSATPRAEIRRRIFLSRPVLGLLAARFLCDPIWWLYVNWLPLYLHEARGMSLKEIGASAWVPFAAAGLGSFAGGYFSRWVIRLSGSVPLGRKLVIAIGGALMPVGAGAAWAATPGAALACMAVALFGFQFWIGNVQALPTDLVGLESVGAVSGSAGTAAGLGAMLFTLSTGWVVDHFSYTPMLILSAVMAPAASILLLVTLGRMRRVDEPTPLPEAAAPA